MARHTPGPWTVENTVWLEDPVLHPAGGQRHTIIGADCGALALVLDDEGDPEGPANVALLAAAPDLLAALRDILADCRTAAERRTSADWDFAVTHAIEYASAAIAKVEAPE